MTRRIGLLAASAALALLPAFDAQSQEPLSIAKQGYLFAGGKYTTINGRQVLVRVPLDTPNDEEAEEGG